MAVFQTVADETIVRICDLGAYERHCLRMDRVFRSHALSKTVRTLPVANFMTKVWGLQLTLENARLGG